MIRDRLFDAWTKTARKEKSNPRTPIEDARKTLEAEGRKLRAAGRPGASILISVDQAEEMARADGDSGEALADYLRVALAARKPMAARLHYPYRQLPEFKAIADFRTSKRAATTCAPSQCSVLTAWSKNRPSALASKSTTAWSMR